MEYAWWEETAGQSCLGGERRAPLGAAVDGGF
jgi:hypothetical protein